MKTALLLDFDGTIALKDVGDELCDAFAPPRWKDIDDQWHRGELTLDAAQRQMWAMVRASPADFDAVTRRVGTLRPGFSALLERARLDGWRLFIASGGFDRYIALILGPLIDHFDTVWSNRLRLEAGGVQVEFPHSATLNCGQCAVCKGVITQRLQRQGYRVVFCGDGSNDRCTIGRADRLFAVAGSRLAAEAQRLNADVVLFDSFEQVARDLWG